MLKVQGFSQTKCIYIAPHMSQANQEAHVGLD